MGRIVVKIPVFFNDTRLNTSDLCYCAGISSSKSNSQAVAMTVRNGKQTAEVWAGQEVHTSSHTWEKQTWWESLGPVGGKLTPVSMQQINHFHLAAASFLSLYIGINYSVILSIISPLLLQDQSVSHTMDLLKSMKFWNSSLLEVSKTCCCQ